MSSLINAINDILSREKINQSQFAKSIGIKQCLMSQIINGKRRPSLNVIRAIYRKYPDLADVLLK